MKKRIEALEQRVAELEARLGAPPKPAPRQIIVSFPTGTKGEELAKVIRQQLDRELFDEFPGTVPQ